MSGLTDLQVRALMELEYNFPLTSTDPYADVASSLGVDEGTLLQELRLLRSRGILKRVGFYYNFRSQGKDAALVALRAEDVDAVAKATAVDPLVTHSYLRDDPDYNVWIVVKRDNMDEIIKATEELARVGRASRYVILTSVRTYKLSVKYDLVRGVSRAGRYAVVPPRAPRPEALGVPPRLPEALRSLPLEPRPYSAAAKLSGLSEEEIVRLIPKLLEAGVLLDPGAAVDGESLGFKENGMVVMEPSGSPEELCEAAARSEYSTHVVLRSSIPEGAWRYPCYAMIHAVRRDLVEEAARIIARDAGAKSYRIIYSIRDLKPGVVR
ncbi:Lrp/AsnC family transcriptional regulator [Acidilobus sp.]|uniref:Lrp/AsnC family transcriptional regulator n=1 Tax=Acidilobus sp. TaxID=1872109 RepID=UPI003D00E5A0